MNHPCLVTPVSSHWIATALRASCFLAIGLVEVDLPRARAAFYPKPPAEGLKDPDAAIRYAINHPLGSDPLYAKLRPGMKVTIAIDDISVPLPPMKRPDARERVLTIVLALLADHGVDDIELIVATGIHRRMKPNEISAHGGRQNLRRLLPGTPVQPRRRGQAQHGRNRPEPATGTCWS